MRRFLSVAVGFAAFSFSAVAAPVLSAKSSASPGQATAGKIVIPHPKNFQVVPNYKAAYIMDQRKRRGQ